MAGYYALVDARQARTGRNPAIKLSATELDSARLEPLYVVGTHRDASKASRTSTDLHATDGTDEPDVAADVATAHQL
jgi:hypothetical protein